MKIISTGKYRIFVIRLLIILFSFFQSESSFGQLDSVVGKMDWISGHWRIVNYKTPVYEDWKDNDELGYLGTNYVIKEGDTIIREHLKIWILDNEWVYTAFVNSNQGWDTTHFRLMNISDHEVVFINEFHDFPQHIKYSRTSNNSIKARISTLDQAAEKAIEFNLIRAGTKSTVFQLDIWAILIIISIAHCFFVTLMAALKGYYLEDQGKWFIFLLVLFVWYQAEFLFIRWPIDLKFYLIYGTRYGSWLLLGPVLYFYFRSFIKIDSKPLVWLHFAPFGIVTLLIPFLFNNELTYRQAHYGMLTVFDQREQEVNLLQYFYGGVFIIQFIHLGFYLWMIRYKFFKAAMDAILLAKKRWLHNLWSIMFLILILCSVFLTILFLTDIYRRSWDYLYVLPFTISVYLISYQLTEIFSKQEAARKKYEKSGLDQDSISRKREILMNHLKKARPYLEHELRLKDLAEAINMPQHQLSELLNQHLKLSFFDLINQYRVEEAKIQIIEKPEFTLMQIAFDSGFSNKTTFVNAFKKFEGMTPSQYMRKFGKPD